MLGLFPFNGMLAICVTTGEGGWPWTRTGINWALGGGGGGECMAIGRALGR